MIEPLRGILRHWDVDPTFIEPLGPHPNVARVKEGMKVYYLKKREDLSIEKRWEEFYLTSYLLENRHCVESPLLTSSGYPFVKEGEQIYSLYKALEGRSLKIYSMTALANAGAYLSDIHLLFEGYRSQQEVVDWDIERHVKEWMSVLGNTSIGKRGAGLLSRIEGWKSYYTQLPHQIVHSDFHSGNILMKGEEIIGVIDFARIRTAPRITDIAYFLAGLLKNSANKKRYDSIRCIQVFLDGYESNTSLTTTENRLLPSIIILFLLQYAFLYSHQGYSEAGSSCMLFIEELINSDYFQGLK
ncbi:phosphotransferase [Rossellomorea aquimaris]|uniref:phosphotransferase n=1 Tax=Rossellomorea TaxID=2837508 RepID=UPI001CD1C38E|nr:phosphotransferase [Rossellomorea aquimaris]MCA1059676.1 phosphotransferase [Rossellomorea aquimaris]